MRKIIIIFALLLMCSCVFLVGCSNSVSETPSAEEKTSVEITFRQSGYADIVKIVKKGETLTDIPTPAQKTGYTVGWDRSDFSNITENIIVTAVGTANKYTVTFIAEGFEINGTTLDLTYGEPYQFDTLVKTGKDFLGWRYSHFMYTSGTDWNVADNILLVAAWKNKDEISVTFKNTNGDIVKTLYKGETLTDIPTPEQKTGYLVDSVWYISELYNDEASFENLQDNIVVYAKSVAKTYTIRLNPNGGNVSETTIVVTFDTEYSLPEPTHQDCDFDGWQLNGCSIALNGIWDFDLDGDIILVAKWEDRYWSHGWY